MSGLSVEVKDLSYAFGASTQGLGGERSTGGGALCGVSWSVPKGSRVLLCGANGAGKSTMLSILGGKRMVDIGKAFVNGKQAFHCCELAMEVSFVGDWWKQDFFLNTSVKSFFGEDLLEPRAQKLLVVLGVETKWCINAISDGQRRRVQLLAALLKEKDVYLMDEVTTDLDLVARHNLLEFLKQESERGATVIYATHIFDSLELWATHLCYMADGKIQHFGDIESFGLTGANPLYTKIKDWMLASMA